jgi:hypothetical protein
MTDSKHALVRRESPWYFHFFCPFQLKLELRSYGPPKKCPICRDIDPLKLGRVIEPPEAALDLCPLVVR